VRKAVSPMFALGRRWDTVLKLGERRWYISELADELKKTKTEALKYLKELENAGFAKSEREGRRKYFSLTDKGRRIFDFFMELERPTEKLRPRDIDRSEVERYLIALDTKKLSNENIRYKLALGFSQLCGQGYRVWKHSDVSEIFKKMVEKPEMFEGQVGGRFRVALEEALRYMMEDNQLPWVMEHLYEGIDKGIRNSGLDDGSRSFEASLMKRIFWHNKKKQDDILKIALDTVFDSRLSKETHTYKQMKDIIQSCLKPELEAKRDKMFSLLLEKANSSDPAIREKAEDLIDPFITPGR